jgi:type II secretory pathway pseudopilin PulG
MVGGLPSTAEIKSGKRCWKKRARSERGSTLIETMVAVAILFIVVAGLLPVFFIGVQTTNQQADLATRTTEYAQDKMEQLLALNTINLTSDGFNDGTTDTTVFPSVSNGSTGCTGSGANTCGLGGTMAASSSVGSVPPAAAVKYFVDYLDVNGNLLTSSAGAYYTRQWKVTTDSTATLKTITIVATAVQGAGIKGLAPSSTLVCVKSSGL